jgi:uncharacterized protein
MNPPVNNQAKINISHLRDLTIEYGEGWGYPHVCRVLRLAEEIGTGLAYDQNILLYAAYLHDWGAFPHYSKAGVEHALRSMQVAETEILPHTTLPENDQQAILDAVALHDYRDLRPATAPESLLLREADMLDMLGAVGVLREFAWGPNDLKVCCARAMARRDGIVGRLTLPRAKSMAEARLTCMERLFSELISESFGIL